MDNQHLFTFVFWHHFIAKNEIELPVLLVLFYIIFASYITFLLAAIIFWHFSNHSSNTHSASPLSVSVIIAARNEEDKIRTLLESLDSQLYPRELLEIILINDHSEDHTVELIQQYKSTSGLEIRLLNLNSRSSTPKKDALKLGIQNCRSAILLFTDADCTMPRTWVKEITLPFQDQIIDLAVSCIKYNEGNFLEKLLSQEQAALLGSAFATLKIGVPTMCNGANMAIRRTAYENVKGFDTDKACASGDDELLLHKVFSRNKKSVAFIRSKDAIVTTESVSTYRQLFQQRKRWAGKWEKYILFSTKAFALFIFLFHFIWTLAALIAIYSHSFAIIFLIALTLKLLLELVFISSIMQFLDKKINLLGFGVLQFAYSPYVVFFGLISRGKNYIWKGRELK